MDLKGPAQEAGFTVVPVSTTPFTLYSWQKLTRPGQDVTLYIEGDGHAWVSRYRLSTDPTPVADLVRQWALRDPGPNVVYLARPCQFIGTFSAPCHATYWSDKRFAPEVIASVDQALDQIKAHSHASGFRLIGYSGGGAVAALLAARRTDIHALITVAGNLDSAGHTKLHGITPLNGSLNPLDSATRITAPQIHYVGGRDRNIPPQLAERFIAQLPPGTPARLVQIPGADHTHGWDTLSFAP